MIIDAILDRQAEDREDRTNSWGHEDYEYLREEADMFGYDYIAEALAGRVEEDVQEALCRYIDEGGYNPTVKNYIRSKCWVPEGDEDE